MSNIIIPSSAKGGAVPNNVQRRKIDKVKLANKLSIYYDRADVPVENTMDKEALDRLHAAIRYTQMFKQQESYAKMDEEITDEVINGNISKMRELAKKV